MEEDQLFAIYAPEHGYLLWKIPGGPEYSKDPNHEAIVRVHKNNTNQFIDAMELATYKCKEHQHCPHMFQIPEAWTKG